MKENVNAVLKKLAIPTEALFSTLGRVAARAIETRVIGEAMGTMLGELIENLKKGDLNICEERTWDQLPGRRHGRGSQRRPPRRAGTLDQH